MSDQQLVDREQDMAEEQPEKRTLSRFDRCDQCGYAAFYMATFEFGNLYFCGHHYRRNEEFIYDNALQLVDESEFI